MRPGRIQWIRPGCVVASGECLTEKETEEMNIAPGLMKLLILAVVLYVVVTCYLLTDLNVRVAGIEHALMHTDTGSEHQPGR
jgi:hypothetical protein